MSHSREEEGLPFVDDKVTVVEFSENVKEEPRTKLTTFSYVAAVVTLTVAVTFLSSYSPVSNGVTSHVMKNVKHLTTQHIKTLRDSQRTIYSQLTDDEHKNLFENFKNNFKRNYKDKSDESSRLAQFKENLQQIDYRNAQELLKGGSAVHGITQFSDLSAEEFKTRYTNYKKTSDKSTSKIYKGDYSPVDSSSSSRKLADKKSKTEKTATSVTSVDWTGVLTTEVKDQGYCGSCWAFSAAEQIESDSVRAGYLTTSTTLSEQQIVSCDPYDLGCDGGNTETAYYYVYTAGGITTEAIYPYTSYYADTGVCKLQSGSAVVTVTGYYTLNGETSMKDYVLSTGPLSVCLDASDWASYVSGVVSSCGTDVDHCVQAVGVNTDEGYWKIRNSWGTTWGESGYIYLQYGQDTCYITYDPTFTVVKEVSSYYGTPDKTKKLNGKNTNNPSAGVSSSPM